MHAADTLLSADELRALWAELALDESLGDHYELSEHGEVIMSPKPTNRHQVLCSQIAFQIQQHLGPMAVVEAAVLTVKAGVRVPDVAWMPAARWRDVGRGMDLIEAPELVVEVLSPGNRKAEMRHKVAAYLESGVREVIVVPLRGPIVFHRTDGEHPTSSFGLTLTLPD